MIGDLVQSDLGTIYRVKGVRDFEGGEVLVNTGKSDIWYQHNLIKTIPLTKEILETNGFDQNFSERYTKIIVPFEVNVRGNNKYITLGGKYFCNCDYVHELQHVLRICGLNELADNFKIK